MPFRFRREATRPAGPRREFTGPLEPQPPLYRSPTLKALVARLAGDEQHNILDLQAAVGANIEFFSRFACRFRIVDLPGTLDEDDLRPLLASEPEVAFLRLVPRPTEPYDVVLAWEAFNYLTRDQMRCLADRLAATCRADALMLAFFVTTKHVPSRPPLFRIVDEETVRWQPTTVEVRPAPGFAPAEIERLTQGFAVVHSVLMRHGVREYLFQRRGDPVFPAR